MVLEAAINLAAFVMLFWVCITTDLLTGRIHMHNASLAKRAGLALLAVVAVLGAQVWGLAGIHWSPAESI